MPAHTTARATGHALCPGQSRLQTGDGGRREWGTVCIFCYNKQALTLSFLAQHVPVTRNVRNRETSLPKEGISLSFWCSNGVSPISKPLPTSAPSVSIGD